VTTTHVLILAPTLYVIGFATGHLLGLRRGRGKTMRELLADPDGLRHLAAQVDEARFRARAAHAQRSPQGLTPQPPE
jgi:hypothetical protein